MKFIALALLLGFTALIAACSPSNHDDRSGDRPQVFSGDLVGKMQEIYSEPEKRHFSPCDIDQKAHRLELARALEDRRSAIDDFYQKLNDQNPKDKFDVLEMGRFRLLHDKSPVAGKDEWSSQSITWGDITDLYEKIKSKSFSRDWVYLDRQVRGRIVDDEERIIWNVNYSLRRQDGPQLLQIRSQVQSCLNRGCQEIYFSDEDQSFLKDHEYYPAFLTDLTNFRFQKEFKEILQDFADRLNFDARYFEFRKQNHRADSATQTLFVYMNQEMVGGDTSVFEKFTSQVWSKLGLNVVIKWDRSFGSYDLFSIFTLNQGERAFVNTKEKAMHLPLSVESQAISHEFGHILGLADEYYTTWNPALCSYHLEFNSGDIMSDHTTGQVLPAHIDQIKKAYFQ